MLHLSVSPTFIWLPQLNQQTDGRNRCRRHKLTFSLLEHNNENTDRNAQINCQTNKNPEWCCCPSTKFSNPRHTNRPQMRGWPPAGVCNFILQGEFGILANNPQMEKSTRSQVLLPKSWENLTDPPPANRCDFLIPLHLSKLKLWRSKTLSACSTPGSAVKTLKNNIPVQSSVAS